MITPGSLGTKRASANSAIRPMTPTSDRRPLPAPDVADRLDEHRHRVARRLRDADHLRQLADRDVQAEPDDEAVEHRPREEAGDEAHPGESAGDVDHAHHQASARRSARCTRPSRCSPSRRRPPTTPTASRPPRSARRTGAASSRAARTRRPRAASRRARSGPAPPRSRRTPAPGEPSTPRSSARPSHRSAATRGRSRATTQEAPSPPDRRSPPGRSPSLDSDDQGLRRVKAFVFTRLAGSHAGRGGMASAGRYSIGAPEGGTPAPRSVSDHGVVVDSVNVSVFAYAPVRSASVAPIDCLKSIATASLLIGAA